MDLHDTGRDPLFMLEILPIILCCIAQIFTYYAQIMPNSLFLSSHALLSNLHFMDNL